MTAPMSPERTLATRANSWITGILVAYFAVGLPIAFLSDTPFSLLKAGWSIVGPACFLIAWVALIRIAKKP